MRQPVENDLPDVFQERVKTKIEPVFLQVFSYQFRVFLKIFFITLYI